MENYARRLRDFSRYAGRRRSVKFNEIYNVHCELLLDNGRVITLNTLQQSRTYAGLQIGAPNKDSNDRAIQWHLEEARKLLGSVGEPFLIEPERREYHIKPGDMQCVLDRQNDHPPEILHIPEWVPDIYSIGVFQSLCPARDKTKDFSMLTILWYQPDFGLDANATKAICLVDWDSFATDLEW